MRNEGAWSGGRSFLAAIALCAAAGLAAPACTGHSGNVNVIMTGVGGVGGGHMTGTGGRPPPTDIPTLPPGDLMGANIPMTHPRLFFTPERLERAKQWYASHTFTPRTDRPLDQMLHYLLSGNKDSARAAITHALGVTFDTGGTASDGARWEGENVVLAYDWCYPEMTAAERTTLMDRWNGYITTLNAKSWGGIGMEANNYYTGYMRNAIEWGIATYWENDQAAAILQHGLKTRWTESLLPYLASAGLGGVPHEGSQYGRQSLVYYTIPVTTATLLGRNMWDETAYFRQTAYYFIYSMTPAQVALKGNTSSLHWETFPFNDDEVWLSGSTASNGDVGTYLVPLIEHWQGTNLAGYMQQYLDTTKPEIQKFAASVQIPATPRPFTELPFDYYAPGIQSFYTRNGWDTDAMAVAVQAGMPKGVGHEHLDIGNFQITRKNKWLTRETVSYTEAIAAWNNGTAADARAAFGHNVVLFQGVGETDRQKGNAKVLRLESRPDYSYLAADLTDTYLGDSAGNGNANAKRILREFLFIRALDTLVVLDRLQAASATTAKTFIVHSETAAPTLGTNSAVVVNGDQALQVMTLLPASGAKYRVVTEGSAVGQYRLEIDSTGPAAEETFLHVLHGRDATAPALQATVSDDGSAWQVTITHVSWGSAKISFAKGLDSTGGSFGYAASGTPSMTPLIDHVQTQELTDDGPVWKD
jgi:hypothetical protein